MAKQLPRSLERVLQSLVRPGAPDRLPTGRLRRLTDPNVGMLAAIAVSVERLAPGELAMSVELFEQAMLGGLLFPATVPISVPRAMARALNLQGRPEAALQALTEAERSSRAEDAHCELTLTLLDGARLNAELGRRKEAMRQALDAARLAQRLGMPLAEAAAREIQAQPMVTLHPPQRLIMVSDVVGSTAISHQQGDRAYFDLVMEHHGIVRQLLATYSGTEFSEGGDSLLVWFESADEAIDCARAIQARTARRRRAGSKLAVKIGIAGGDPFFRHGRPYGAVVNRASRLAEMAKASQIIMDESASSSAGLAGPVQIREVDLRGMGTSRVTVLSPAG
jgi:class 3 adenylate cyclase